VLFLAPFILLLALCGGLLLQPGRYPRVQRAVGAFALVADLILVLMLARLAGVGL
jgi:hypothetical protein